MSQDRYFNNQNGGVVRLSDLQKQAQREPNADYRRLLRQWVTTIEAGGLPEGWKAVELEDRDSRAGTGVYGFEH
jgi:hypothetical protein